MSAERVSPERARLRSALTLGGPDRPDAASVLTRRLLPLTASVLVAGSVLRWLGERAGLYGSGTAIAVTAPLTVLGSVALILFFARSLRRVDQSRRRLEGQYQSLVEQLPLVVYIDEISDNSANIYTSPQAEAILGYSSEEWRADPDLFVKLLHPADRDRVLRQVRECNATGRPFRSEYRLIARDGRAVWMHDESVVVYDENGEPLNCQGYLLDITARKEAEARLEAFAFSDSLTGLANRAAFLEALAAAADDVAVFFLDLDDFKTVNDSLGHEAGDDLLRAVADRLRGVVRSDELVARLGGDEFALLAYEGDRERLAALASRLLEAVAHPAPVAGRDIVPSVSIGIARRGDSTDLLRDADLAMYAAKDRGGGTFQLFEPGMHTAMLSRLEIGAGLRSPQIGEQLLLDFQPTVDLRTGRVRSVEALLRWQHPERGLLPPLEFVPIAEQTGAIVEIGRWVLDRACAAIAELEDGAGGDRRLGLSVNVSAHQLRSERFLADVASALARAGLPADVLTLELTESVLMADDARSRRNLERVRELGVRLAIDDFGAGYSSLAYLRDLAVDEIKLDRSFLARVESPRDHALVSGIVELAKALEIRLVAEGVETAAQVDLLRRLGCHAGQGSFLGRPLPAGELGGLVDAAPAEHFRLRIVE